MEKKYQDEGRKSWMTKEKIAALDSLGFKWAKPKGHAAWNLKFTELKAYKKRYGHCKIRESVGTGIGSLLDKFYLHALSFWLSQCPQVLPR